MTEPKIENLVKTTRERMGNAVGAMQRDFGALRTGKASPALVESIIVDYYGSATRLRDIAGITAPEPRMLVIQPWDQGAVKSIEKAILSSELGISPVSDGRVIRLPIPELSEERRRDMAKLVRNRAEDARIEARNIRRESNDAARKAEKQSELTEDDLAIMLKDVQKVTDETISEIDRLMAEKERELMHV